MKQMKKDSLGNRMKEYESTTKTKLMENMPVIIRLDGCGFSKFTKNMEKPFDKKLIKVFEETCLFLASNIPGVKYVYHQSDEISLLIRNDDTLVTQSWFGNDLQKLVSVTASMTTAKFNEELNKEFDSLNKLAFFDSRVFLLPEREVHNYFLWRQQDAIRNAISMYAQSMFTHKELQNKSTVKLLEMMLKEKNIDYLKEVPLNQQRGASFEKENITVNDVLRSSWKVNHQMPLLREQKDVFYKYLK